MNIKTSLLTGSALAIGSAAAYGVVDWTAGESEIVRKGYHVLTDAQGNPISQHSDPAKAFQAGLNQAMKTGGTYYVTPPPYEITYVHPDIINTGDIEVREAGGYVTLSNIDLVKAEPPIYEVLVGTVLVEGDKGFYPGTPENPCTLIQIGSYDDPAIVFRLTEPTKLTLYSLPEDPEDPQRKVYEVNLSPSK